MLRPLLPARTPTQVKSDIWEAGNGKAELLQKLDGLKEVGGPRNGLIGLIGSDGRRMLMLMLIPLLDSPPPSHPPFLGPPHTDPNRQEGLPGARLGPARLRGARKGVELRESACVGAVRCMRSYRCL